MNLFKYFIPQVLFEGSSPYSKDIKVIKVLNNYKLIVDGVVQSCSSNSGYAKSKVWGKMAQLINKRNPSNTLLLGMGAGTLLKLIRTVEKSIYTITSVEIDPVIIYLAKKYFELDKISGNRVIQADAFDVVTNPQSYSLKTLFDCIVVDTYSGSTFPEKLESDQFYRGTVELMTEDACLIINRIINKGDPAAVKNIREQLSSYVKTVEVYKVKCPVISDNYLFLGTGKKPRRD